jgi:MoxR-like ATPase
MATTEAGANMQNMSPSQLETFLSDLVENRIETATMIWGPPGIGKSSIVAQVCEKFDMKLIDLRISQLAPTDLRGLPVPDEGTARWLPPNF